MKLTALQWNIGGGKIRTFGSDASQDASFNIENIDYIAKITNSFNPDIVTMQETHSDATTSQAEVLSNLCNLSYWINDQYDHSHVTEGQMLSQSILSRYPLEDHHFQFFTNPKYQTITESGQTWVSHDKGVTSCVVTINHIHIPISTLHLIPFKRFGVDPLAPDVELLRNDIQAKIRTNSDQFLIQGDFNFDGMTVESFLPSI